MARTRGNDQPMANISGLKDKAAGTVETARAKRPFLDHLVRAYSRYQGDAGDRLAAAVTYFAFLSFFPLVALAFSVLGFTVANNPGAVSYTHLRAHETVLDLVCRPLLEKTKPR